MLSHRSGVAALDVPISNDQAAALDPVLRAHRTTAALVAAWARSDGYHAMPYGFIVSGLVRAARRRRGGRTAEPREVVPSLTARLRGESVSGWCQESPGRRMDRVKGYGETRTPALGWSGA